MRGTCNTDTFSNIDYNKIYSLKESVPRNSYYEVYRENGALIGLYQKCYFDNIEEEKVVVNSKPNFIQLKPKNDVDLVQINGELTHAVLLDGKVVATFTNEFFAFRFNEYLEYDREEPTEIREIA